MIIKYSYKVYEYCPLATFVDKNTHQPSACRLISFFLCLIVLVPFIIILNCLPEPEKQLLEPIFIWLAFIFLVLAIVFSALLPKISDHFKWADRIAVRHLKKLGLDPAEFSNGNHNNEWKCTNCGRINKDYIGTCACGVSKPK